jgi:hypothetical protein
MTFKINGIPWTIQMKSGKNPIFTDDDNEYLGFCEYSTQTIILRNDMPTELIEQTLIHELTHAFVFSFGLSGYKFDEEKLCNFVGAHLKRIHKITKQYMKRL